MPILNASLWELVLLAGARLNAHQAHYLVQSVSLPHYWYFECIAVRAPTRWRKIKCSPSTLFGSVRLFTPLLVDLERILEAIVSSQIYPKLQNTLGIVPSFPMVMVCIRRPMSQISSHYAKIKGTSESCWRLKIPKRERCSCGGGTWQDDFRQESQHDCFWETTTKRNTSIWVLSCWKSAQNKCLVMNFLTVLTFVLVGVFRQQENCQQNKVVNNVIQKHVGGISTKMYSISCHVRVWWDIDIRIQHIQSDSFRPHCEHAPPNSYFCKTSRHRFSNDEFSNTNLVRKLVQKVQWRVFEHEPYSKTRPKISMSSFWTQTLFENSFKNVNDEFSNTNLVRKVVQKIQWRVFEHELVQKLV